MDVLLTKIDELLTLRGCLVTFPYNKKSLRKILKAFHSLTTIVMQFWTCFQRSGKEKHFGLQNNPSNYIYTAI